MPMQFTVPPDLEALVQSSWLVEPSAIPKKYFAKP
jgi:hypothetical protein